jgi:hypothetical protein
MRKVISFGLYGNKDIYNIGAIENAKLVKQIYGDEWEGWFYICEKVDIKVIDEIRKYAKVIIIKKDFWIKSGTFWRMLPIEEEDVEIMMVRDVDSRLSIKEKILVDEWLKTDKKVHIIRDHPIHNFRFMACSFNIRKNEIQISDLLKRNQVYNGERYLLDQLFLQDIYYPLIKNDVLIHDSYHKYNDENIVSFPRTSNFIGERVMPNGITEKEELWKKMKGRYIYMIREIEYIDYRNVYDFMYELMEYIQIARKTNRTLVIPRLNIRNGNKMKSIDLFSIIEEMDLKKICNIIDELEYNDILKQNNINSIVINRLNYDVPIINKKLYTNIGKIEIEDSIDINFDSLNILKYLNNEILNEFESIIVYNYNRMNKDWNNMEGCEYFLIRHCIIFKERINDNYDDTIYIGNNISIKKIEEYMNNEIKRAIIFDDNGEIEKYMNLNNIEIIKLIDNSLEDDIVNLQKIASCKYHIIKGSGYNNIKSRDRWMVEEKYIYYTHNNWFYNIKNDIKFII